MSDQPTESPEQAKRRLERMGLRPEQVQEVQRAAQALAQQQVKNAMTTASNFITTVVALLSSAVGIVAALAWNTAIASWLPTLNIFKSNDKVTQNFAYAIVATIFAVLVIAILGIINGRIKGRSLINNTNPFN
jgi:CBS domain containing-hemolysin-like protein